MNSQIKTTNIEDTGEELNSLWTVPSSNYTDESVYTLEQEKIFAKSWVCVAHASDVKDQNAYITRQYINEDIIIVRGQDDVLRAFFNVCPHRGHQLLKGDGKVKGRITCPYHSWAFKLDGDLAFANNCKNVADFDLQGTSLSAVKVEQHAGFIFLNMDLDAEPVATQLPGFAEQLATASAHISKLKRGARFVTRTPANWKAIVDNYLECYHCKTNHVSFSDSVDIKQYTHSLEKNWTLQYGVAKPSDKSYSFDENLENPSFQGFWIWPCTMINIPPGGEFMTVIYEYPESAGVTVQNYEIYFLNDELTEQQQDLVEWYRTVFRPEDLRLVESVQKGMNSRGFKGRGRIMVDINRGGLSEHGVAYFHKKLQAFYQQHALCVDSN
jgi:choline monooxygenase